MRQTQNQQNQIAMKTAKRIALTILCCLPFVAIFAYLMRNILTENWMNILCETLIMGVAVLIVELVHSRREQQKNDRKILEEHRDVFK